MYFYVTDGSDVINNTYNKRQDVLAETTLRGSILSSDGQVLAQTVVNEEGEEVRNYPLGNLFSHVVGYTSNGMSGIESLASYYLLTSNQNLVDKIHNDLAGDKNVGDNITTSLDARLQKIVYDSMGQNRGAVVILNPQTGEILSMVSKPDFDPNTIEAKWNEIVNSDSGDSVLYNRATQGQYPPGSTFKLVTMLEYIREHPNDYQDYRYDCKGSYHIGDTDIKCAFGKVHGEVDTRLSIAYSCNCSMINIGLSLDLASYRKTAEQLLFNQELPLTLAYNKSQFVLKEDSSKWDIATTSFGQGKTLITPIHLAMLASSISNNGKLMSPYLLESVVSTDDKVIKNFGSSEYGNLMTSDEAGILRSYMEAVVKESFGWLYGDNYQYYVAGKTGTAQYGTKGYEHSLFTGIYRNGDQEYAIGMVIEGGDQRKTSAIELSKVIFDQYFAK